MDEDTEDNEQGRGPGRDLPEAGADPEEENSGADRTEPELTSAAGIGPRTEAPVQAPHWQALRDISRVLPCQVQPVNSKDWYTVDSVRVEDSGEVVLITSDGDELRGRDIHDPVLVRTNDPDAGLLH